MFRDKQDREGRRQAPLWRVADRLQVLLYWKGWPARLARRLGWRPRLRMLEYDVELRAGPPEAPPLRVAFATDFHAGFTTDPVLLREACATLSALQPDVLLLGGDFVALDASQIDWLAPLIGRIDAPLGRFAVMGNHDRWNGGDYIARRLETAGIEVLTNRNHRLCPPFRHIWICGIDDFLTGTPDARSAVRGADGARIVLMHSPSSLLSLDGERFDLALCGHTHGGQITLGGAPIHVAPGPLTRRYNRGRYRLEHGEALVVSAGLGCSTVPIRFNCDPEIILCSVRSSARHPLSIERAAILGGPGAEVET